MLGGKSSSVLVTDPFAEFRSDAGDAGNPNAFAVDFSRTPAAAALLAPTPTTAPLIASATAFSSAPGFLAPLARSTCAPRVAGTVLNFAEEAAAVAPAIKADDDRGWSFEPPRPRAAIPPSAVELNRQPLLPPAPPAEAAAA